MVQDGWPPEIKSYGPLLINPMSSFFQHYLNVFEGVRVFSNALCEVLVCSPNIHFNQGYKGLDGKIRFFRLHKNMEPLTRSVARIPLPVSSNFSASYAVGACHSSMNLPSGKRGFVLEKPRLLWVSLETIKTSKIQRPPGRPWRKVP